MITIKVWENSKLFLTNYLQGKEGKMTLKESLTIWSDATTLGFQELKEEAQNIILKSLEVGKLDIIKQNLISFGNQFDLYSLTKESSFGEDTGEGKQGINGADLPYIQQIVELATNLILEKAMVWLEKAGFGNNSEEIIIVSDVHNDRRLDMEKRKATKQHFSDVEARYLAILLRTQNIMPRKLEICILYIYIYIHIDNTLIQDKGYEYIWEGVISNPQVEEVSIGIYYIYNIYIYI